MRIEPGSIAGQEQGLGREVQGKGLRAFSLKQDGARETDLNEIMRKVESVLEPLLRSNGARTAAMTFAQQDLKIMAEDHLLTEALLSIIVHALQSLPEGGALSLDAVLVDFNYQSVLDDNQYRYGACASFAIASKGIRGGRTSREATRACKMGSGENFNLFTAHTMISQHHGSIRKEHVTDHGVTTTIYVPLVHGQGTSRGAQSESPCMTMKAR